MEVFNFWMFSYRIWALRDHVPSLKSRLSRIMCDYHYSHVPYVRAKPIAMIRVLNWM